MRFPIYPSVEERAPSESLLHQEFEVRIEKMAITGEGVARHQTAVIFVPWACPGDQLKIRVVSAKKNHYHGEILEILKPGPSRVEPPCEYVGQCGGCTWQQISREQQLVEKQNLAQEILSRFLPDTALAINPIIPSPKSFGYRSRIQPRLRGSDLGFYRWKSHDWIPTKDCLLVEEPLREYFRKGLPKIKAIPSATAKGGDSSEAKVELFLTAEGKASFRILEDEPEDQLFSQVNQLQNEELVKTVVEWSQGMRVDTIFDLYAGAGNFSFPLSVAHKNAQVIGVEASSELVRQARKKSEQLKIPGKFLEFYAANTDLFLRRFIPDGNTLVVLDPPRGGASEFALRSFAASGLKNLIYISCNPVSLGRDLGYFKKALGAWSKDLKVGRIQPFEMFPQTNHLELVVELTVDSR